MSDFIIDVVRRGAGLADPAALQPSMAIDILSGWVPRPLVPARSDSLWSSQSNGAKPESTLVETTAIASEKLESAEAPSTMRQPPAHSAVPMPQLFTPGLIAPGLDVQVRPIQPESMIMRRAEGGKSSLPGPVVSSVRSEPRIKDPFVSNSGSKIKRAADSKVAEATAPKATSELPLYDQSIPITTKVQSPEASYEASQPSLSVEPPPAALHKQSFSEVEERDPEQLGISDQSFSNETAKGKGPSNAGRPIEEMISVPAPATISVHKAQEIIPIDEYMEPKISDANAERVSIIKWLDVERADRSPNPIRQSTPITAEDQKASSKVAAMPPPEGKASIIRTDAVPDVSKQMHAAIVAVRGGFMESENDTAQLSIKPMPISRETLLVETQQLVRIRHPPVAAIQGAHAKSGPQMPKGNRQDQHLIQIHIGTIDVKAATPAPLPARPHSRPPVTLGFDEYEMVRNYMR